jgi:hypothetical protein
MLASCWRSEPAAALRGIGKRLLAGSDQRRIEIRESPACDM